MQTLGETKLVTDPSASQLPNSKSLQPEGREENWACAGGSGLLQDAGGPFPAPGSVDVCGGG